MTEIPRRIQMFKALTHGTTLFSNRYTQYGGKSPLKVRVTGKVQTWVTRPDEFKVPVKLGLYDSGYITHTDHQFWEFDEETAKQKLGIGKPDPKVELEKRLVYALQAVWAAIGSDCIEAMQVDCMTSDVVVDLVLDCNRVEMYGQLSKTDKLYWQLLSPEEHRRLAEVAFPNTQVYSL